MFVRVLFAALEIWLGFYRSTDLSEKDRQWRRGYFSNRNWLPVDKAARAASVLQRRREKWQRMVRLLEAHLRELQKSGKASRGLALHGVESLSTGEPKVNYRETVTAKTPFDYLHKRQSGGRGQYGKVIGYFEPVPEEDRHEAKDGIVFVNKLVGNDIPPSYVPSIEKGFRNATQKGLLIGSPLIYTRCVLEDGASHEVDSSSEAFMAAAQGAFESFYNDANPVVLEPLMKVEVTFPSEFQAQTMQTLNNREGSIQGTQAVSADTTLVEAVVPLRRMFGYSSDLRSVTQGQGEFSMEFQEYTEMPQVKQEELMQDMRRRQPQA
eukprot:s4824_g3.t1